ncbi:hypothetical protein M885DRAFT_206030 [Pelagophyceae sp. CCMP2097]|nr:hypothetical protein M885DRAFT_206030 [Pelagophyceae sp. CCMP2097]
MGFSSRGHCALGRVFVAWRGSRGRPPQGPFRGASEGWAFGPCHGDVAKGTFRSDVSKAPCHGDVVRGSSSHGPCHTDVVAGTLSHGFRHGVVVAGSSSRWHCQRDLVRGFSSEGAQERCRRGVSRATFSHDVGAGDFDFDPVAGLLRRGPCTGFHTDVTKTSSRKFQVTPLAGNVAWQGRCHWACATGTTPRDSRCQGPRPRVHVARCRAAGRFVRRMFAGAFPDCILWQDVWERRRTLFERRCRRNRRLLFDGNVVCRWDGPLGPRRAKVGGKPPGGVRGRSSGLQEDLFTGCIV